jgi:hypothetical protein
MYQARKIKVNFLFSASAAKWVHAGHVEQSMSSEDFAIERFESSAGGGM